MRAPPRWRARGVPVAFASIDVGALAEWARDDLGIERLPAFTLYRSHGAATFAFPSLTTGEAVVAGAARMVDHALEPELTPARLFGEEAEPLSIAEWLFWRGTSDAGTHTTRPFWSLPYCMERASKMTEPSVILDCTSA